MMLRNQVSMRQKTCRSRFGFTLLELLIVMGIMVLLMSIGVAGFLGIRRGAELRGAVNSVRTTLMLARQQAVTKRCNVVIKFIQVAGTNSMQVLSIRGGSSNLVHGEVMLSPAVEFKLPFTGISGTPPSIRFASSGAVGGSVGKATIVVQEKALGGMSQAIDVWLLTGVTKVPP